MYQNAMDRKFGIELEYIYPNYDLARLETEVTEVLYPSPTASEVGWGFSYDGGGIELSTPVCTWAEWPSVSTVMRRLAPLGHTSTQAGFHLHLDNSDFSETNCLRTTALWCALEEVLFRLVSRSRRSNWACERLLNNLRWENLLDVVRTPDWDRTQAFFSRYLDGVRYGFVPHSHHGTFEIRIHQSTMNPTKVRHWVLLMQAFVAASKELDARWIRHAFHLPVAEKLIKLLELVDTWLPPEEARSTATYLEGRYATLA